MTLWCIIPAKPFEEAKSRLAPQLSPPSRKRLAACLFRRTLRVVCGFAGGGPVLVVSRSAEILDLARAQGAIGLREDEGADMNTALAAAGSYAITSGASSTLAISADLPVLGCEDLAAMTAQPSSPAIAPDRHGTGSNAVFWNRAAAAPYRFGADSFARHVAAMSALGGCPRVVRRKGLALDLDEFGDLCWLNESGSFLKKRTKKLLLP